MKRAQFLQDAFGEIEDAFVLESMTASKAPKRKWIKWASIAASFAVVFSLFSAATSATFFFGGRPRRLGAAGGTGVSFGVAKRSFSLFIIL